MVSQNREVAFVKSLYVLERKGKKTFDPNKKLTVRKKLVKQPKVLRCIYFKGGGLIRVLERKIKKLWKGHRIDSTDLFPEFALYMKRSKTLLESLINAGFTQEQPNKWVLRTNLFSVFVYT